jgi:ribosomal-protein-alanine N-acetyltransferase
MAVSPVIEALRVRVVPFVVEEHLTPRYVGWLNDPAITRFSEQRLRSHSLASCLEYARSFEGTPHHFWAVVARDQRLGHIGNMNAYVDTERGVADVGILIGEPAAHGQGYATEAWTAVVDHLLRVAGLRKITAGTLAVNRPMVALMARVGMVDEGGSVQLQRWGEQDVEVVHRSLSRQRWMEKATRP